jgi:hypothetical protein
MGGGFVRTHGGIFLSADGMADHVHLLAAIAKDRSIVETLRWSGTSAICGIEAPAIGGALPPLQGSGQGIQI